MKFTPIPLSLPSIADEAGSERNPGLHISGVIKHLLMQMDPKKYGSDASDDVRVLWEMGLAWEEIALSRAFWERIMRRTYPECSFVQVQAQQDGLWGTCDMISLGDKGPMSRAVITESKLTQISAANEIDSIKFWSWHVQMKAYCHMWGARKAVIPVCFLFGDYRPKRILPRAWDVEFTKIELVENWDMILQARDEILAAQKATKRSKKKNG